MRRTMRSCSKQSDPLARRAMASPTKRRASTGEGARPRALDACGGASPAGARGELTGVVERRDRIADGGDGDASRRSIGGAARGEGGSMIGGGAGAGITGIERGLRRLDGM